MEELRWFRLCIWIANHRYPALWQVAKDDCRQIAGLTATQFEGDTKATSRTVAREMSRGLYRLSKDLGFHRVRGKVSRPEGQFNEELANADRGIVGESPFVGGNRQNKGFGHGGHAAGTLWTAVRPCGVLGCKKDSMYDDSTMGRLCKRHKSIVDVRRRRGKDDPYKDLHIAREAKKNSPKASCGVPWCSDESSYNDSRYSRLCHRHAVMRNKRKRLGWEDPYLGFEESQEVLSHMSTFLPERNRAFWATVRLGVTKAEWAAMWLWAYGETPAVSPEILAKAKEAGLREKTKESRGLLRKFAATGKLRGRELKGGIFLTLHE